MGDGAVMLMLVAQYSKDRRSQFRPVGRRSDHHRYGEVKTRLTIGIFTLVASLNQGVGANSLWAALPRFSASRGRMRLGFQAAHLWPWHRCGPSAPYRPF